LINARNAINKMTERREILALLVQRMAQLPAVPKKVLAMYYYENMQVLDIAACLGLSESRIRQIHAEAMNSLKTFCYSCDG
jgi:RNA polymerase sigma factor for flagellar operon FliA